MVTVYDVARVTGLSIASVSRALNGQRGVSKATAEQVRKAAVDLGYVPNDMARSLVGKSTRTIALLLPDITNPFFPELVKGVQTVADAHDHMVLLIDRADEPERIAPTIAVLRRKKVDGAIAVAGPQLDDADAVFASIPTVFLDRETLTYGTSVGVDNYQGSYDATRYLIDRGHRRIAHLAGPAHMEVAQLRLDGWRRACEEASIPHDESLVHRGAFLEEGGYAAGADILSMQDRPTAVVAANDLSAIGFLSCCADRGVEVPRSMSLIGFDGIHLARYTTPRLTTVVQPATLLGETATQLLLDRIRGLDTQRHTVLPTSIDAGGTVGPPDGKAPTRPEYCTPPSLTPSSTA